MNVSLSTFLAEANFGKGDIEAPAPVQQEWSSQMTRYESAMEYFHGLIFNKRVNPKDFNSALAYPLKVNLVKTMCLTQAAALWGQWEDSLVSLTCQPIGETAVAKQRADQALSVIQETWDASHFESKLLESGLSAQVYGGSFFRAVIDPTMPHGIRMDKLMPYNVFVRWHPLIVDRILEAYIVIPIDKDEAQLTYGIKLNGPEETVYIEHWTESTYDTSVGDTKLEMGTGINPWGFVPIEYVPRLRLEGFYGLPLVEDLTGLQDELNSRLADIGDNINNASHPIRWIVNYRGDPDKDFAMGADALWNLGHSIGGQDEPKVGVLPAQPEPASSFNFINFMMDMTRYSSFTSPVAFGQDEGSQRSGVTLELRLWPMLQQAKTTRVYYRAALDSLHRKILKMARFRNESIYDARLLDQRVMPDFAQLVPRDRQILIDEVTRRAEQDLISPEEAVNAFGARVGTEKEEVDRIKDWVKFKSEQESRFGGSGSGFTRGVNGGAVPSKPPTE
jgi:hypothetical protein